MTHGSAALHTDSVKQTRERDSDPLPGASRSQTKLQGFSSTTIIYFNKTVIIRGQSPGEEIFRFDQKIDFTVNMNKTFQTNNTGLTVSPYFLN